jgi:hypothetical protein
MKRASHDVCDLSLGGVLVCVTLFRRARKSGSAAGRDAYGCIDRHFQSRLPQNHRLTSGVGG